MTVVIVLQFSGQHTHRHRLCQISRKLFAVKQRVGYFPVKFSKKYFLQKNKNGNAAKIVRER